MSKGTLSTQFRKVNVDLYNDDNYQDEVAAEEQYEGPSDSEITQLLNAKRQVDALKIVLTNPPLGSKSRAIKAKHFELCMRILQAFSNSEVESAVKSLDPPSIDILMKYIYRGFNERMGSGADILLLWHSKVFAVGGYGCIVRVMTDRKQV